MLKIKYEDAPDDVQHSYFTRALNWYYEHRKGQPSLNQVKALAEDLYNADEFVKASRDKKERW